MGRDYVVTGTSVKIIRQVLLALKADGAGQCVVIGDAATQELSRTLLCDEIHVISICRADAPPDDARFVQLVNHYAALRDDAVLIPADVEGARMVARNRTALRMRVTPFSPPELLDVLNDKWRFFQFCCEHDLPVPPTRLLGDKEAVDFVALASELGLPMIIKPIDKAGSEGVVLIADASDFRRRIRDNPDYAYGRLIAQRYIDGIDLCFNLLAVDGIIVAQSTQRRTRNLVRFLENAELGELGRRLARASQYHGVMCIDARQEHVTGKIYLIESNPRFWASLGASAWCGLNFVTEAAKAQAATSHVKTSCTTTSHATPHHATPRHAMPSDAAIPDPEKSGPISLSSGEFNERHPLMRPVAWPRLLLDTGRKGRFLRAWLLDLPVLCDAFGRLGRALRRKLVLTWARHPATVTATSPVVTSVEQPVRILPDPVPQAVRTITATGATHTSGR